MADADPFWRRLAVAAREVWSGATGSYRYEAYCRHRAEAHPGAAVPTRADYEKAVMSRRYEGINRCC